MRIMSSARKVLYVGIGFASFAFALLLHHWAKHGYLVDKHDIENHEFFIGAFGMLGLGLIIGGGVLSKA